MIVCMHAFMYACVYVHIVNLWCILCCFYVLVPDEKLDFELELALVSSQPWVTAPKHLCMWSGGKPPLQVLGIDDSMIHL